MNIEFGCGNSPTFPDYKTCDVRDLPGVDFVCPATEIGSEVEKESVDKIFSRHFFEHLTFAEGEFLLDIWKNILKPGGTVEMILPNMALHVYQWITKSDMRHAKGGFWGWQRDGLTEVWDVHKSGYDKDTLKVLILDKGYIDYISHAPELDRHLHVTFRKAL